MAPRTLDAVPIPTLAIWGLRGLTAIDPTLTPELHAGSLQLVSPGRILFAIAPPAGSDALGWGDAAAAMCEAAWGHSAALREAGTQGIVTSFFDELFNHLDPYSRYVAPTAAIGDVERRTGTAGIGATLARHFPYPMIARVLAQSPADAAGLRPGDVLLSVDGRSTRGASPQRVAGWLAGPDDSLVVARVLSGGHARTVRMARATMPPETVFADRTGDLLVIRITAFAADTAARLQDELTRGVQGAGLHGVVLDLRGNRGGLLLQAIGAAAQFMAHGLIAVTAGRDPQSVHVFRAGADGGRDLAAGLPVVVLVDGRSASAAEILAAALADDRRGVVVGSVTLGKGLVQTVTTLPDGGELFVTWSRVLAPRGWPLQGLGVMPQVCTSLGQAATDRQLADLAAGRDAMADALARSRAARAPLQAGQIIDIRDACPAAEGRREDLRVTQALIGNPTAYAAALLPPPGP
jgi:carboxyl-terminal processing protease